MSAAAELQRALVAAFATAGVPLFDGPPRGAVYPFAALSDGGTSDWGTKDLPGREHRLSLVLWDDGGTPARLHALADRAEAAVAALPRDLPGHRIASLVLLRTALHRDPAGPWAARLDYRVRTLETSAT